VLAGSLRNSGSEQQVFRRLDRSSAAPLRLPARPPALQHIAPLRSSRRVQGSAAAGAMDFPDFGGEREDIDMLDEEAPQQVGGGGLVAAPRGPKSQYVSFLSNGAYAVLTRDLRTDKLVLVRVHEPQGARPRYACTSCDLEHMGAFESACTLGLDFVERKWPPVNVPRVCDLITHPRLSG
jgi:hypothetical protein